MRERRVGGGGEWMGKIEAKKSKRSLFKVRRLGTVASDRRRSHCGRGRHRIIGDFNLRVDEKRRMMEGGE